MRDLEFIIGRLTVFEFNVGFIMILLHRMTGVAWAVGAATLSASFLAGAAHAADTASARALATNWTATWMASPQPVWGPDFLFPTNVPAQLQNQTVRQVARLSLGGSRLRIVLSNAYGKRPVLIDKVTLALPLQGEAEAGAIAESTLRSVTFSGQQDAKILPGASLVSDPVAMAVPALAQITVSLHLPNPTPMASFHWDGRQTGWIVPGSQTQAAVLPEPRQTTTARTLLTGVYAETESKARAVAVLGDSMTDGATASIDQDTRWPDFLAARLAPHNVAVINAGISGARLLSDGMGVNALARLDRDVLAQPGVESLMVLLGINDIAWPGTVFAPQAPRPSLHDLTAAYRQLIEQAHSHGIRVIGATLLPFEGALPGTPMADYYNADKDALRRQVNEWIRHSGAFDAVIDFDAVMRDPEHPAQMRADFDSGDHLHPGDAGNREMAGAVGLGDLLPGLMDPLDAAETQVRKLKRTPTRHQMHRESQRER